jgi:hypothetical protein
MPPRLPRRNDLPRRSAAKAGMKAGRGWGILWVGGYKDFAPDGAATRRAEAKRGENG